MLHAHAQVYVVATNWGQGSAGFVKYYNPEAVQLQRTSGRHRQYAFPSLKLNRPPQGSGGRTSDKEATTAITSSFFY